VRDHDELAAPGPHVGAVLCGGRSSRFGTDKAIVEIDGQPLAARIVTALRAGGADPVVAVGGSAGDVLGVPTVPDRFPGEGPLAALATALLYARAGLVVVTSCDLPLLRGRHVAQLIAAASEDLAAVATIDGRPQPSLACWPARFGPAVSSLVTADRRAWRDALEVVPWTGVAMPPEAVADADTPEELKVLLARRHRDAAP